MRSGVFLTGLGSPGVVLHPPRRGGSCRARQGAFRHPGGLLSSIGGASLVKRHLNLRIGDGIVHPANGQGPVDVKNTRNGRDKSGSVTIKDVAAASGVSKTTVSRVLNDDPNVRASTRERVLRAISKLNYRPNLAATGLKGGRTYFLGVIIDHLTDITAPMISVVEAECRKQGYSISLFVSGDDSQSASDWIMRSSYLEGIIFLRSGIQRAAWESPKNLRSIYVYCLPQEGSQNCVYPDNVQGAYQAVEHLIELGHDTIGYINGPKTWEAHTTRYRGWAAALRDAGLDPDDCLVAEGDGSIRSGYTAALSLLGRGERRPTAIFACSDRMAVGAMRAATELGLAIPRDLSIVGYENKEISECTSPPLTTVDLSLRAVAITAVGRLLDSINADEVETWPQVKISCELIVRDSTGPARK